MDPLVALYLDEHRPQASRVSAARQAQDPVAAQVQQLGRLAGDFGRATDAERFAVWCYRVRHLHQGLTYDRVKGPGHREEPPALQFHETDLVVDHCALGIGEQLDIFGPSLALVARDQRQGFESVGRVPFPSPQ